MVYGPNYDADAFEPAVEYLHDFPNSTKGGYGYPFNIYQLIKEW